jgi:hypothetical protein
VSDEAVAPEAAGEEKAGKKKKAKKAKKGAQGGTLSVRSHPRAARSVRRTRATAGLVAFFLTLLMSIGANVPAFEAAARSLGAGIAINLLAWWVAMAVWRQLIIGELRALHAERVARREALAAQAAEAAAAAAAAAA